MALGTTYLTASSNRQGRISARLIEDSARYGYSVLSNGCRANKTPFLNILAGLPNMLPPLLPLIDCTDYMAEGDMKDGTFLHSSAIVDGYSYSYFLFHSLLLFMYRPLMLLQQVVFLRCKIKSSKQR